MPIVKLSRNLNIATIVVFLLAFIGIGGQSVAQAPFDSASDTFAGDAAAVDTTDKLVFVELELAPDGVLARDISGGRWRYDFELDEFVPAQTADVGTRPGDDPEAILPVEKRCTERKDVQIGQKYVHVGYEEYVDSDIIAAGRVIVQGWVQGNIRSLDRVLVMPTGQVDGNIEAPDITVKDGGVVYGRRVFTTNPVDFVTQLVTAWGPSLVIVVLGFLVLFTFVAVSLAHRQLGNVRGCIDRYRVRTLVLGAALLIVMVPAMIVFAVTIVGLILTFLTPIAYLMAIAAGIVAASDLFLRPYVSRIVPSRMSFMFQSLLAVLLFSSMWFVVAILLTATSQSSRLIGAIAFIPALLVSLYPVCTGLGAAFLTRFGYRRYVSYRDRRPSESETAPAPPPIPKAPPSAGMPSKIPARRRSGTPPLSEGNE